MGLFRKYWPVDNTAAPRITRIKIILPDKKIFFSNITGTAPELARSLFSCVLSLRGVENARKMSDQMVSR